MKGGRLGVYCDSQADVRWSALSYRYLVENISNICIGHDFIRCSLSSPTSAEEQRVTEGTYFDWCEEEGCDNEGTDNSFILRQKVSDSRRRRRQLPVDGCVDFRLTESNNLRFTLIDCDDKRKPLCLRGNPIINNLRKRMKKKRKRQRKKDLRMKQIRGKSKWRKMFRNKKRRGRQLLREEPGPPVEMCATAGR